MSPGHLRRRSDASSAGPDLLSSEPGSNFHGRQSFEARNDDDITDDDERVTRTFPQERFLVDELGFGDESIKVRVVGERAKWWKIYTMHFMFMWNTRTYEYASIILVASAFPQSLVATSIRGITYTISSILCASAVGSWIDRSPTRLPPLLLSISFNHAAIVSGYLCWLFWPFLTINEQEDPSPFSNLNKGFLFGLILFLDAIQEISHNAARLSLEQDWIPVLVGPITTDMKYSLTQVNAVMRRIDLLNKIISPSLLPLVISSFDSRTAWILLLSGWAVLFWSLEIWLARMIARDNHEQIQLPKKLSSLLEPRNHISMNEQRRSLNPGVLKTLHSVLVKSPGKRLKLFFSMDLWPASMAGCFLFLTVLTYSSTFITHLLQIGFPLSTVTIARASGSILALSATFITPAVVKYLRKKEARKSLMERNEQNRKQSDIEGTIVRRVGQWGISWQFICLVLVVLALYNLSSTSSTSTTPTSTPSPQAPTHPFFIPLIMFTFLSLSRIGLWTFELMIQELEQTELPPSTRSTFVGTEQSLKSFFELCHWAGTVLWPRPEEFRFLALGSVVMVGSGAGLFSWWVRRGGKREREGGEYRVVGIQGMMGEGGEDRDAL